MASEKLPYPRIDDVREGASTSRATFAELDRRHGNLREALRELYDIYSRQ